MRAIARSGLLALSAAACLIAAAHGAYAQAPPAKAKPAAPAAAPANTPAQPAVDLKQTLATVNGEAITKGELFDFLSRYQIQPGNEDQVYHDAIDSLVNSHLVNQYLIRQKITGDDKKVITADDKKVDEALAQLEKRSESGGSDLATQMIRSGKSLADVRAQLSNQIRWFAYLNEQATEPALKQFADAHKDLFSGTRVKISHILLRVDPKATSDEKEKARQKLLGIKKEIEANKMSFAEAANKYSEDPSNSGGAGGDIGYFSLNEGLVEEFANAAFALKKGVISDPIETPYGLHLILVTDRKEGTPLDFEQNKPLVKQIFAADLQKNLLTSERKKAKIEIKPMPADIFPAAPTAPAATTQPEPKK